MATGSSPLLDQYNRDGIVTPALQKALDMARQKMGEQFQLPGGAAPASPATPTLSAPGAFQVPTISRLAATPQPLVGTGAEPGGAAPTLTPPSAPAISQPRPAPSAAEHQQELTRLTTGATGKSGIEQIQNPWLRTPLRVLDALGSAFVPALTAALPGTQFHHQGLVNMARGNVNQDEAQATAEASRAHMGAETDELPARAEHERAQAEALAHPKAQLEWQQGSEPEIDPAHPELGPQAVWYNKSDPTQKHFGGAPVAAKPVAEKNEPHYEKTDDGSIIALTKDKDGKPGYQVVYHGDPKVETEVADLEVGGKPHKVIVNKKTGETIKDLGESGIKPPAQDYGTNFIDPATNTVVRVRPGQKAPEGGLTTSGFGTANAPTAASKTVADQARAIRASGDKLIQEIDAKKGKIGNLESYFNQYINGTPIADKDVAGLMTSLSSFAALQPKLHGFRSHDAMKEFSNIIGGVPKDPEALKASIRSIQNTAEIMERMGKIRVPGEAPQGGSEESAPNVTTKEQYDALPKGAVYMEDGKKFKKP